MSRNRLIVLSGIPGSGKSTYCQEMAKLYEGSETKVYVISSDDIRYEITGRYDDFNHEEEVWGRFNSRAYELSKEEKAIVILDATTLTNKQRYNYALRFAKAYTQIYLVVFNTLYEQCLIQNKMRKEEKWVPEDAMERMQKRWEPIDRYTCFAYFHSVEYYRPGGRIRKENL